jgi:hypothetical protein
MSKAAKTLAVFSIYLFANGLFLMAGPELVLQVLDFPLINEIWVRIVGLLLFLFGFYYIKAAYHELSVFFAWSVQVRVLVFSFFSVVTILGLADPVLMLLGVIDLGGAIWTWRALHS